jgi:hypothetical protein
VLDRRVDHLGGEPVTETHPVFPAEFEWLPTDAEGNRLPRIEVQFVPGGKSYAYAWNGDVVAIGDQVRTPRPYRWCGERHDVGTVTRIGSGYEGPVLTLTERVGPGFPEVD